jgi:hypothetical protein
VGSALNSLTLVIVVIVVIVVVAAWRDAAGWMLIALSAVAGVTLPALSATMRALWPRLTAGGAAASQALAGALIAGPGVDTALWLAPVAAFAGFGGAVFSRKRMIVQP